MTLKPARLQPSSNKLIEAGFVFVMGMIALLGFTTTFDSWYFLVVCAIGLAFGIVIAYLVYAIRWHWTLGLAVVTAVYYLLGGAIAIRQHLIAAFIPSQKTLADLSFMAWQGWKHLLTTLPPVDGQGSFLAIPLILALVFACVSYGLSRAYRVAGLPLLPQVILYGLVIALGTSQSFAMLVRAITFVLLCLGWASYRGFSANRLRATRTRYKLSRAAMAVGIAVIASLTSVGGPNLPGVDPPRDILRDYVKLPIDLNAYPSPMPSFRKYSSTALKSQFFYDDPLMTIQGASPGSLIRFAVLDSYDGLVWGASGGGFRRVGTRIDASLNGIPIEGDPVSITVTIDEVFASQAPLNIWVPALGYSTSIDFSGDSAESHKESMIYDLSKGQGLVLDQLKTGDVIEISTIPMPVLDNNELTPAGETLVFSEQTDFLASYLEMLSGGNGGQWDQIKNIAAGFKKGGWTDGTTRENESQYTPGCGQGRLTAFLGDLPNYVGSDEQYSAAFALAANRLGFPARVIFGARMPQSGTVIEGKDVTIWVEVQTLDGWIAIPPEFFIPPRDQSPKPPPPLETTPPEDVEHIEQPNPKPPPDDLSDMDTQAQTGKEVLLPDDQPGWFKIATWVGVGVGSFAFLVGALLTFKAVRSRWRRTRGTHVQQIAGGWRDTIDCLRDLGVKIPQAMTRQEQALALAPNPLLQLASASNRAMFGPTYPTQQIADSYWAEVRQAKRALLADRKLFVRLWARITPRSFVPLRTTHRITVSTT